jgi:hypothetical protein
MRIPRPTGPRSSRAPAFIMPLAALCGPLPDAALPLRPPSTLRGGSIGVTMTVPGGTRTPPEHCNFLRARPTGFSHRVGAS